MTRRGLRPELIPGVEIVEVLPAVDDLAVLHLEDEAAVDVERLAVSLRGVVMDADHATISSSASSSLSSALKVPALSPP